MAKRHHLSPGSWASILGRLEELVLANSGEDEFQEIFKLLLAKLLSESDSASEPLFAIRKTPQETASAINDLLERASRRWKGVLEGRPKMRLRPDHLAVCVSAIEDISILGSNLEVLDALFEDLISKSSKGSKGQYFTPRHVIDLCVQMVAPGPTEMVVDPACGSGGFLIHAWGYVRNHYPDIDVRTYARNRLWGADFDARAIQVARALMLVAGDGHSNLLRLNSLLLPSGQPKLPDPALRGDAEPTIEDSLRARMRSFKGFDIVLTNPPFAGEVRETDLLHQYALARKNGRTERDILFLERCLSLLRPGGRMGIVLPHNKFASSQWASARSWLVQRAQVVAVVGLGRYTFLPHTSQKAAVLFVRKRASLERHPDDEPVFFAVSERDGKNSKGEMVLRGGADLEAPAWERIDHDLTDILAEFWNFVRKNGIEWSTNV